MRLKRVFKYKGNMIEDFWPAMSPDQVKKMLSGDYPEIINSSYTTNVTENEIIIEFTGSVVGTRG